MKITEFDIVELAMIADIAAKKQRKNKQSPIPPEELQKILFTPENKKGQAENKK